MINLLYNKDLEKQPAELKLICKNIFCNGKGVRPKLVSMTGGYIGLKNKEQALLSRFIEYIHNSSLLHDDFIDQTKIRHNNKTAWLKFSPAQAVLAGDYLLARVNIYLAKEKNLELLNKTAQVICDLAEGEFLQRQLLGFKNKDFNQRNHVNELKTASLFKWCLQAPFIYKNRNSKKLNKILDKIGCYMGLLFQRSDDLIDFNIRNQDNKPCLIDIKETYFNSFSCFLLKRSHPEQEERLKKARSLSSIYKIFPDFQEKVKSFDSVNEKLIQKAEVFLDKELKPFLKKKERDLISALKNQLSFFYWRRKKTS